MKNYFFSKIFEHVHSGGRLGFQLKKYVFKKQINKRVYKDVKTL